MANEAFVHGFDTGYGRADEQRQHAQALADQEHAQKIGDLINQRQELATKIPSLQQGTPEYEQAHQALQKVNLDIAEAYHPVKNPGAIEKLGHLLTDHVGITKPQDRAAKQAAQAQTKTDAAAKATDAQIAAAPIPKLQSDLAEMQAKLKAIDASNLDDDGKKRARERVFGVTSPAKPTYKEYLMPDGVTKAWLDPAGEIPEGATAIDPGAQTAAKVSIADWEQEKKEGKTTASYPEWLAAKRRAGAPSTSAINEGREDYSKSHGFGSWNDIPDQYRDVAMNYIIRKQAMDKAYPTSTTSSHLQADAAGQFHNVTETNYKTPGGMESLKDPLWFLAPPVPGPNDAVQRGKGSSATPTPASTTKSPTPAAASGANASTPTSSDPKALKKEAAARAPKPVSGNGSASKPPSDGSMTLGNVKISGPIMAGKNKEYDDAQSAYDSAIARVHTMEKSAKEAAGGDQQAMLSLVANHIGMTLGAQKGARINQAVWNEAVESAPGFDKILAHFGHFDTNGDWVLDTPFKGYKGGVTLTGDQIKSMVKLAHEQVGTFKDNRDQILKRLNQGVQVPIQAPPDSNNSGGGNKPASNGLPKGWN